MSMTPADAVAAGVLFQEHHSWLLSRLQQRLRNRAEAEDVASETFIRVMGYERVRALNEPRAYLSTVAKSVLARQWRRRELERAYIDSLAALPQELAPSAEERVALFRQLERIAQALDTLSPRARRAFLLSQLDGLTYAEIAQEVGVSVSAVRQYMAQGLRACLLATQA